ncbi:hypothetical protein L1987_22562 [Smallanthus sonchifolius]|uniref:Uncharacterized protein n=1 Tax=Smallanthus sonchifolius TaxID=185202 RepID=A0ACB9IGN8_9ASTR|nr:hypothetical protein L1987_22562 [Smallanthus sonchifolius]
MFFTPRKKKWVILLAVFGFSSYGVYKVYSLPSVSRKRKIFVKLLVSLISILQTISDSSEIVGVVSRDLKQLLASDQGQIPNSLKQLSKIAVSDEFSKSLTCVSEAVTLGVIQGYNEEQYEEQKAENSSFKDRVIDKLMSESGTGFVSVVVGSFARNLVMGFDSNGMYESGLKLSTDLPELVDVLSTDKSKLVMGDLIKTFVSTAVAVYLDRPTSVNLYDGVFSGMTDPKHEKHVKDIAVYVCSGAVETLIKTSHQVLTS